VTTPQQQYDCICPLCDRPLHRQAMAVETVVGRVHQACALQLEQQASRD
jgi:hypothetical protein